MLRDAARHIRLIDQHRVDTRCLHREWTIAQYHPRMVAHPLDRESKGLEPSQPAEFVIELLERPERIILNADLPELDANARLHIVKFTPAPPPSVSVRYGTRAATTSTPLAARLTSELHAVGHVEAVVPAPQLGERFTSYLVFTDNEAADDAPAWPLSS